MYWEITKDLVTEPEDGLPSRVGRSAGMKQTHTAKLFEFRMYDSNGELYYIGRCDQEAFHDDESEGGLYSALQFAEWDAGATDLRLKLEDVLTMHDDERMQSIYKELARRDGWVSIYG